MSILSRAARTVATRGIARRAFSRRVETAQAQKLTDIGTRPIFDETHDQFREMTRKFYAEQVVPNHPEWEDQGHVPKELWQEAGALGLLSVTVPEEYGGYGLDCLYSAIVWEEQAYSGCTGPGFALHSEIVAPYIVNYGTEEQKQRILPKLVSGEWVGALAMTEPSAGSDFANIKTYAKQEGDDWILNGSKVFITNGFHSDVVIVCAKTATDKGAHGITLFLVEEGMEGFVKGKKLKKMGMKAQDTSELFFEDVRLPKSAILGEVNKGFYAVMQELPQERLLIADIAIASGEAVYVTPSLASVLSVVAFQRWHSVIHPFSVVFSQL